MDSRGLYLNKWTPNFDPEHDIPNAIPVWVRLPHLPLHCWGDESIHAIGNAVGNYIARSEPRDNMQACARICVEVDLGRGLPEAIKLKVDNWTHIQQLDYEQIPFKCKVRHKYGHFANRCTKNSNVENVPQEEQWEPVKKKKSAPSQKSHMAAGPSTHPSTISPSSSPQPSLPLPPSSHPTLHSVRQLNPFFHRPPPIPSMPFPFLRNPQIPYLNLILPLLPFP